MSDAAGVAEPRAMPVRNIYEQWMFDLSPFGTFITSVLVFLFWSGTFAGATALDHSPFLDPAGKVLGLAAGVWPALIFALLTTVILGTQRWARGRDDQDAAAYALVFHDRHAHTDFLDPHTRVRLRNGTIIGAVSGAIIITLFTTWPAARAHPFAAAWFAAITVYVSVLTSRGVVLSTRSSEMFDRSIRDFLVIDLLRVDLLAVIGRNRARTALIWFAVAAVICLFFVGDTIGLSTLFMLLFSAGMGLWTFIRPMERVHRAIRAAKAAELERIRKSIAGLREDICSQADAAARLHGLLAYEKRIEDVREWPFDQTTALRLSAYLLIPAIPWFGQAIVQYFVERVAHTG